jgi:hypothetical protein
MNILIGLIVASTGVFIAAGAAWTAAFLGVTWMVFGLFGAAMRK